MSRFLAPACVVGLALTVSLISVDPTGLAAQTPAAPPSAAAQAPVAATPENVAAFLGDWTLSTTGANGPATTALTIKVDAGKVTAEISSEAQGRIAVTDIKRMGAALLLSYGFDYQGTAVPVVLTLTPAGEKVSAEFDFASGAYLMAGTAVKKK